MNAIKYLKQLMLIMSVSFVGELLNRLLPFPVPGSVYGLVLMLICLLTGLIRLEQVEETADFLVKIMPVLFIGPCVSTDHRGWRTGGCAGADPGGLCGQYHSGHGSDRLGGTGSPWTKKE